LVSPLPSSGGRNFSFLRMGLRPRVLPLYFLGWVLRYQHRWAALRLRRLRCSSSRRFCSAWASRRYRRRSSSRASLQRFMMWKQSSVRVAFGKAWWTMEAILSDRSAVTSFTRSRCSSGILSRMDKTSSALVPRTAAISVPSLQWPSLFVRNVNRSSWRDDSSMLRCSPMFPGSSTQSEALSSCSQSRNPLRESL